MSADDPLRPGLENALAQAKESTKPTETPGLRLDNAIRGLAVAEIKAKRAREVADKAREAAEAADAEVACASVELQEARQHLAVPPPAQPQPQHKLQQNQTQVRETIQAISAMGFHMRPGMEDLGSALQHLGHW